VSTSDGGAGWGVVWSGQQEQDELSSTSTCLSMLELQQPANHQLPIDRYMGSSGCSPGRCATSLRAHVHDLSWLLSLPLSLAHSSTMSPRVVARRRRWLQRACCCIGPRPSSVVEPPTAPTTLSLYPLTLSTLSLSTAQLPVPAGGRPLFHYSIIPSSQPAAQTRPATLTHYPTRPANPANAAAD
jgi:hypothetical protein